MRDGVDFWIRSEFPSGKTGRGPEPVSEGQQAAGHGEILPSVGRGGGLGRQMEALQRSANQTPSLIMPFSLQGSMPDTGLPCGRGSSLPSAVRQARL